MGVKMEITLPLAQAMVAAGLGNNPEVQRVLNQADVDTLITEQADSLLSLATFTASEYSPYVGSQVTSHVTVEGKEYAVTVSIKDIEATETRREAVKAGKLKLKKKKGQESEDA